MIRSVVSLHASGFVDLQQTKKKKKSHNDKPAIVQKFLKIKARGELRARVCLRRCRRRVLIFKRISLGQRAFLLFGYTDLAEIMNQVNVGKQKKKRSGSQDEFDSDSDSDDDGKPKTASQILEQMQEDDPGSPKNKQIKVTWRDVIAAKGISFRERCRRSVKHPKFDQIILLAIIVSSVMMVFNLPLSHPKNRLFFLVADVVFAIIFTTEMIVKMISMGVFVNNNPAPEQFVGAGEIDPDEKEKMDSFADQILEAHNLDSQGNENYIENSPSTTSNKSKGIIGWAKNKFGSGRNTNNRNTKLAGVAPDLPSEPVTSGSGAQHKVQFAAASQSKQGGPLAAHMNDFGGHSALAGTLGNIITDSKADQISHPKHGHHRRASLEEGDLPPLDFGPKHDVATRRQSLAKKHDHGLLKDLGLNGLFSNHGNHDHDKSSPSSSPKNKMDKIEESRDDTDSNEDSKNKMGESEEKHGSFTKHHSRDTDSSDNTDSSDKRDDGEKKEGRDTKSDQSSDNSRNGNEKNQDQPMLPGMVTGFPGGKAQEVKQEWNFGTTSAADDGAADGGISSQSTGGYNRHPPPGQLLGSMNSSEDENDKRRPKSQASALGLFGSWRNKGNDGGGEGQQIEDDLWSSSTSSTLIDILYDTEYQSPYLGDAWNVLDFVVVMAAWLDLYSSFMDDGKDTLLPPTVDIYDWRNNDASIYSLKASAEVAAVIPGVKVLRLFRALRPLRMASRFKNLKLVIATLLKSLPQLCNVFVFLAFMMVLFGVFAVSYLKGRLHACVDNSGSEIGNYSEDCMDPGCNNNRTTICLDIENFNFITYQTELRWPNVTLLDQDYERYSKLVNYAQNNPQWKKKIEMKKASIGSTSFSTTQQQSSTTTKNKIPLPELESTVPEYAQKFLNLPNSDCYKQLRAEFFGGEDYYDKNSNNRKLPILQSENSTVSSHELKNLLSIPALQINRQFPKTYNFEYWKNTWPDAGIRESKIYEEITRRYIPRERFTIGTPYCVLNCAESEHPFCEASTIGKNRVTGQFEFRKNIWGHNVMECPTCRKTFCNQPTLEQIKDCEYECKGGPSFIDFCQEEEECKAGPKFNQENCNKCRTHCVEQCLCPDTCTPVIKDAADCALSKGRWERVLQGMGFDNLSFAFFTLFQIITTEGWVAIMLACADSVAPYKNPERDASEIWVIFFMVYQMTGYFFLANIAIGVICDNFYQNKAIEEAKDNPEFSRLSLIQKRWCECQRVFFSTKNFFVLTRLEALPEWRRKLFFFVSSRKFETVVMTAILINMLMMATNVHPNPLPTQEYTLHWWFFIATEPINMVCIVIFNLEFILKFMAIRLNFFKDAWNRFDFICVVSSNIGLVLVYMLQLRVASVISVIRVFRIARVIRLLRFLQPLNQLIGAFYLSIPRLANVGGVLALCLLIFALLGLTLFSPVLVLPPAYDTQLSDSANFISFYASLLLLLRCMTGEGWNDIMADLSANEYRLNSVLEITCIENFDSLITDGSYDFLNESGLINQPISCPSPASAWIFFGLFTIAVFFIVLNLFIAVIFEAFDQAQGILSHVARVVQVCMDLWPQYDPALVLIIGTEEAWKFVADVLHQIGMDQTAAELESDVQEQKLRVMKTYAIQVTPTGETHFLWCCQAILRKMLVANDMELADELDQLEAQAALGDNNDSMQLLVRAASGNLIGANKDGKLSPTRKSANFEDDEYLDDRDPITAGLSRVRRKTVTLATAGFHRTRETAAETARLASKAAKIATNSGSSSARDQEVGSPTHFGAKLLKMKAQPKKKKQKDAEEEIEKKVSIGPPDVIYKMRRLNLIVKRDFERRAQMLHAIESGNRHTSAILPEFVMPDFAGIRIDTVVGCGMVQRAIRRMLARIRDKRHDKYRSARRRLYMNSDRLLGGSSRVSTSKIRYHALGTSTPAKVRSKSVPNAEKGGGDGNGDNNSGVSSDNLTSEFADSGVVMARRRETEV